MLWKCDAVSSLHMLCVLLCMPPVSFITLSAGPRSIFEYMISAVINQNTAVRQPEWRWPLESVYRVSVCFFFLSRLCCMLRRENIVVAYVWEETQWWHVCPFFEYIYIHKCIHMCVCKAKEWGGWFCGVELLRIFRIIRVGTAHKSVWLRFTAVILCWKIRVKKTASLLECDDRNRAQKPLTLNLNSNIL